MFYEEKVYKGNMMNIWHKFLDKVIGEYVNEEINDFYIQIQKAEKMEELLTKKRTEENIMVQNKNKIKIKMKKEKI